ncbi:MAG: hypothetical protein A3F22_03780 [Candidatus Magasanikbacteria bacterium RIFCSPHIGHO2_12_FULL_41_16]|nr:MAG: hypothetical protein A3F22_03780 [Candidatus Magasanikbacteria bacterium RIFCSPHIGHO2_12_FULL_41_16]
MVEFQGKTAILVMPTNSMIQHFKELLEPMGIKIIGTGCSQFEWQELLGKKEVPSYIIIAYNMGAMAGDGLWLAEYHVRHLRPEKIFIVQTPPLERWSGIPLSYITISAEVSAEEFKKLLMKK